jgi:AcrR family transcriptional regulator
LATLSRPVLKPRKSPVQARSAASVDAILEATLQVLIREGKERLTTTRVADRAGVSVGTLYQYFPNKSSLLQAVLYRHLNDVTETVEDVCLESAGAPLQQMAAALVTAFLKAKMKHVKSSVALYSVSSDVDGARIVKKNRPRFQKAVLDMFASSNDKLSKDPELVAAMIQSAITGVAHRLLDSAQPEQEFDAFHQELLFVVDSYLKACIVPASMTSASVSRRASSSGTLAAA